MSTDAQRRRRLIWIGVGLVVAIAAIAVALAVSGGDSNTKTTTKPVTPASPTNPAGVAGASDVAAEFKGIPQRGNVLGDPNAPTTFMVFADMQCPFCAEFENGALPSLVERYVRAGKMKVVFQPVAILGDDSVTGARWVSAAANQNKLFDYAGLFYRNQSEENSGYVTDSFLRGLAKAVPGLDVKKLAKDAASDSAAGPLLQRAEQAARTARVESTPTFMIGGKDDTLRRLDVTSLKPDAFLPGLDDLTGG
jgi:protein-disulfide isomerase